MASKYSISLVIDAATAGARRGVQGVIDALKRLRGDAAKKVDDPTDKVRKGADASRKSIDGLEKRLGGLRKAVFSLKTALFGLLGAAGFGALIKGSNDATDALKKTADTLGISIEALTALRHEANLAGVDVGLAERSLRKLTVGVAEAVRGVGPVAQILEELGLDARELANSGAEGTIESIAKALAGVESQAQRVRIATRLFGEEGADFLRVMDTLGKKSLPEAIAEAQRLGLVLNSVDAAGVERSNDALTRMKSALRGVGTQVGAALAPAFEALADWITESITRGGDLRTRVREITATTLEGIAAILRAGAGLVGMVERNADIAQAGVIGYLLFGRKGAAVFAGMKAFMNKLGIQIDDLAAKASTDPDGRLKARQAALLKERAEYTRKITELDTSGMSMLEAHWLNLRAKVGGTTWHEQLVAPWQKSVAAIDKELEYLGWRLGDQNGVAKYMADTATATGAVEQGMRNTADAADAMADGLRKGVDALDEAGRSAGKVGGGGLSGAFVLDDTQEKAFEAAQDRLAKSTVQTAATVRTQLEKEYADLLRYLRAKGDKTGEAQIGKIIDIEVARTDLDTLQRDYSTALAAMGREEQRLAQQRAANLISESDYQKALDQLHSSTAGAIKAQLETLEAQAAAYEALTGDSGALENVRNLRLEWEKLAETVDRTAIQINQSVEDNFANALTRVGDEIRSVQDLFRQFAFSVLKDIQRIAAQKMASAIFGGMGGGGLGGMVSKVGAFATGGYVSGPGTGTSDSIPARLSNGEYVIRSSAVGAYGRSFLDAINNLRLPRFATGGPVGQLPPEATRAPSQGGQGGGVRIVNVVDPALARDYLTSSDGEQVILNTLKRNPGAVREIIR